MRAGRFFVSRFRLVIAVYDGWLYFGAWRRCLLTSEWESPLRVPIPLYKMFLLAAAYLAAFATFLNLGGVGLLLGLLVGTASGGVILVIHNKKDLISAVIVAFGSLLGAFIPYLTVESSLGLYHRYTLADLAWDCFKVSIGAVVGGLFFSWASKR